MMPGIAHDRVWSAWRACSIGVCTMPGRILLVRGCPGVGKSTLISRVFEQPEVKQQRPARVCRDTIMATVFEAPDFSREGVAVFDDIVVFSVGRLLKAGCLVAVDGTCLSSS